jgi:hypothetical protein
VIFDPETRIVHPDRTPQEHSRADQSLPQAWNTWDSSRECPDERGRVDSSTGVEDEDGHHLHRGPTLIRRERHEIVGAHPLDLNRADLVIAEIASADSVTMSGRRAHRGHGVWTRELASRLMVTGYWVVGVPMRTIIWMVWPPGAYLTWIAA